MLAIGAGDKTDDRKVGLLLTVAGPEALDVYNTFLFTEDQKDDGGSVLYCEVVKKFDTYCMPKKNETYERYIFRSRLQKEGESLEQYLTDLRIKSQSCSYGTLCESLIRDQLVVGILDRKVKERLLRETDLTLDKAIQICQAAETAAVHMQALSLNDAVVPETTVSAVKKKTSHKRTDNDHKSKQPKSKGARSEKKCSRCGYDHAVDRKCPAMGQTCNRCDGKNHFASVCRTSRQKVYDVQESQANNSCSDDEFFVETVKSETDSGREEWISTLVVNGSIIPFKLDTGAQVNVLPLKDYHELQHKPKLVNKVVKLRAYNGDPIPTVGVCQANVVCQGQRCKVLFVVAKVDSQPILGLQTCVKLSLVKRVNIINKDVAEPHRPSSASPDAHPNIVNHYKDVFEGIGCLPVTYRIQLRDDAVPVIHAARKVPVALKPRLRQELDKLEKLNIVSKIEEPTDWVSSLVIVEKKNGDLRLCLDPKDLNQYIRREHYHIPTRTETTCDMAGARYFSKLDASSGFWQIPLEEQSAKLTTFNTPFGRYYFKRLPFGISSAPEVFHRTVAQLFNGLDGVKTIHDDVLVWGTTVDEHDKRLKQALDRSRQSGLKLNASKCEFRVTEVTYLGDRLSAAGVQPDPNNQCNARS